MHTRQDTTDTMYMNMQTCAQKINTHIDKHTCIDRHTNTYTHIVHTIHSHTYTPHTHTHMHTCTHTHTHTLAGRFAFSIHFALLC